MSSNIKVQRICQHCGNEFTARTTVTQYCSDTCSKRAYKARLRAGKVEQSNKETQQIKHQPIEELKAKEFLTVREVARLLNCSVRSAYYYIESGTIKAVNLEQKQFDISDCYNLTEIQNTYGISETALQNLIKRNNIPKIKKGGFAYVPKTVIDKLLI
jgi:excisionase family DNA binding protein